MYNFFNKKEIKELLDEFFNSPQLPFPSYLGDFKTEKGSDEDGNWVKETYKSKDGKTEIVKFYKTSFSSNSSESTDELTTLKSELQNYIDKQDFENAVILRDKIKTIEKSKKTLDNLEEELKKSIENQNFEKSIELRDKINKIKSKQNG